MSLHSVQWDVRVKIKNKEHCLNSFYRRRCCRSIKPLCPGGTGWPQSRQKTSFKTRPSTEWPSVGWMKQLCIGGYFLFCFELFCFLKVLSQEIPIGKEGRQRKIPSIASSMRLLLLADFIFHSGFRFTERLSRNRVPIYFLPTPVFSVFSILPWYIWDNWWGHSGTWLLCKACSLHEDSRLVLHTLCVWTNAWCRVPTTTVSYRRVPLP